MSETSEKQLAASIAAHESWGRTPNRAERTAPARAAADARFLTEADGDPKRAANLRKAYFQRLALKSVQARRKNREAAELLAEVEQGMAEVEL